MNWFFFPISTFFNKCISPTADLLSPWWQSNLINSVRISQIFFHSETAISIYRNRLTWKRISNQHPKSITSFPKILFSWIWLISQSSRKLHISKITYEYKITKFTKKIPNEPTDRFGSSPQESVPLARAQLLPRTNTHTHTKHTHTHSHASAINFDKPSRLRDGVSRSSFFRPPRSISVALSQKLYSLIARRPSWAAGGCRLFFSTIIARRSSRCLGPRPTELACLPSDKSTPICLGESRVIKVTTRCAWERRKLVCYRFSMAYLFCSGVFGRIV